MLRIPMTESQFAAATRHLAGSGIVLEGREGKLTKDDITAEYKYDGEALSVEILERPFFLPLSMIEGRLEAYLTQSIGTEST